MKGFGPYRQSERRKIYNKYINLLIEKGLATIVLPQKKSFLRQERKKIFPIILKQE